MIEVISRGIVILFLFALLFSIEMMLAFTIIVILGGAYLLIFKSTKKILRRVGQERFDANQQRFTAVNEAFGASKEVKIFGLEQIFLSKFSNPSLIYAKRATSAGMLADLPRYALEAVAFGGMLLVMLYLVGQKGDFATALPIISVYAFAGYRMMPSFQRVYHSISMIRFCGPVIDTLHNTIENLNLIEPTSHKEK